MEYSAQILEAWLLPCWVTKLRQISQAAEGNMGKLKTSFASKLQT